MRKLHFKVICWADPVRRSKGLADDEIEKGEIELVVRAADPDMACAGVLGLFEEETQMLLSQGRTPAYRGMTVVSCRRIECPPDFRPMKRLPAPR